MSIFTPMSRLDPEVMMRQVEDALGERIFTPMSRLDPELMLRQIENATGQRFGPMSCLDPELLLRQVDQVISSSGDVGGGGYQASAVHWDGASYLHNDELDVPDTAKISFVVWYKSPENDDLEGPLTDIKGFFVTDPFGAFASYAEYDEQDPEHVDQIQFSIGDPAGAGLASSLAEFPNDGGWHPYMFSTDISGAPSVEPLPLTAYVGDVSVEAAASGTNPSATPVVAGNGVPLLVGVADPGGNTEFDMAIFMMWYGVAIDWSVEANRRKIVTADGKPVDPAEAVTAFGAPAVLLNGDATGFRTNQGTGGAFTLSGSLTNASTSPSD